MDVDPGLRAQKVAEEHIDVLLEDNDFCGCTTCIVREVLSVAWPILEAAAREEVLHGHDHDPEH